MLTIEIGNILLHSFGLFLLTSLYKRRHRRSQELYLLNLAWSELLWNIFAAAKDTISMLLLHGDGNNNGLSHAYICINMVGATGINYIHICAMLYFTGDRLFHILLHARYAEYFNTRKIWTLIIGTWVTNIIISITFFLISYFHIEDMQ